MQTAAEGPETVFDTRLSGLHQDAASLAGNLSLRYRCNVWLNPSLWRRTSKKPSASSSLQLAPPNGLSVARGIVIVLLLLTTFSPASVIFAADYGAAEMMYRSGQYEEAASIAADEVDSGVWNESWPRLLIRSQMAVGRYEQALATYEKASKQFSSSLALRLMGVEVLRFNDQDEQAKQLWKDIYAQLQRSRSRYANKDKLIAMGRYYAERGEDARKVLQLFFDRVREADPDYLEAYLATAELALDKGDFKVAAETLEQAEAVDGSDPRIFYLMARAWAPSDSERATSALQRALKLNPRHVDSMLLQVDNAIDRERYEEADSLLTKILTINLHEPRAWAYRAVLAHLKGNYEIESLMRAAALSTWGSNPEVDHLIGKKLSDKYRFQEGNEYQERALSFDPTHAKANFQLAQDMLRLGYDKLGWELAKWVSDNDPYNVVAHNLVTLHERIREFEVLEADGITLRMDKREAEIYGDEVLELLSAARKVLFEKYDVSTYRPVVVELFPDQKDFAIRTFGLPGGAGYLGVCFGRVITANSPASQGERPANWKSVLWHEFCHVVTLGKTNNRMPRWLSEGISVYEERQRDASWGEKMTPQYREMILGDDLTPVSRLSGAFLNPKSPLHLQFAYFESSLVVEFLVEKYGLETLKQILSELGDGIVINDALARSVGSLAKLDSQFADYARQRAKAFGSDLNWSRDGYPEQPDPDAILQWASDHPKNYWGLRAAATLRMQAEEYTEAAELLETIRNSDAVSGERGGTLEKLASIYRAADKRKREREVCQEWVEASSDALPGLIRLIDFAREREDWEAVYRYAEKMLAVDPLRPSGHSWLAEAAEHLERPEAAMEALTSLLALGPIDRAGVHFRLASASEKIGELSKAKRHVLMALEDAPRYRDALRLLLAIDRYEPTKKPAPRLPDSDDARETPTVVEITGNDGEVDNEKAVGDAESDGVGKRAEDETGVALSPALASGASSNLSAGSPDQPDDKQTGKMTRPVETANESPLPPEPVLPSGEEEQSP